MAAKKEPVDKFGRIKREANGMLSPEVYRKIYECASSVERGRIVEVGTAHGAGTIAMALAAKETGNRVVTIEKIVGGSRERFGGVDENLEIIRRNFDSFGVSEQIDLHIGDVEEIHGEIDISSGVGMLMLDADGAIDRDLAIFYDCLRPGAAVVIDDYADIARVFRKRDGSCRIDLKHRLTYRLVRHFETIGVLVPGVVVNNTYFGSVGGTPVGKGRFSDDEVVKVYRSLVHTDGRIENAFGVRLEKIWGRVKRIVVSAIRN